MKAIKRLFRRPSVTLGEVSQLLRRSAARIKPHAERAPLQVILFIGHHKVGSTSLQDYLSRNAAVLARNGILYPYVDFEGMAHFAAAANGRFPSKGSLPINVREPHNALAFRMLADQRSGSVPAYHKRLPALGQMEHAIRQQIRFSDPHTVILAAEVFANFNAASPALIERLTGYFPDAEFTIVATLRRIDEYLASWHGQRLKFGHQLAPLRTGGIDGYLKSIHFDYRLMVEGWLKALPQARVILRDYADVRANGGSVADFIAQTGLVMPKGLHPERRENDSIHRGIYEIARRGNADLPDPEAKRLREDLRQITADLDLPSSHQIELFGAANRARLREQFQPIDRWLGDVMGRSGFFADLDQISAADPQDEMEIYRSVLEQVCDRDGWWKTPSEIDFAKALLAETASGAT